jgi:hypothetical protein
MHTQAEYSMHFFFDSHASIIVSKRSPVTLAAGIGVLPHLKAVQRLSELLSTAITIYGYCKLRLTPWCLSGSKNYLYLT